MSRIVEIAQETLRIEAESIQKMIPRLGGGFEKAVHAIVSCRGKVILTGIGKSGQIARKIASTLASTGTPAFFLHPAAAENILLYLYEQVLLLLLLLL